MKNSQCNLSALEAFVSLVECNHHQVHTAGTNTGFCKEKIEICTNPPIYASSCKATQTDVSIWTSFGAAQANSLAMKHMSSLRTVHISYHTCSHIQQWFWSEARSMGKS